jgi:transposase
MAQEEWAINLTDQERLKLQDLCRSGAEEPRARLRATQVLMSAAGQSAEQIGEILGVTSRTVQSTRSRWRSGSFNGLYDAPRCGKPPKATAAYHKLLTRTVVKNPRDLGFAFSRWTCPRLAEYLRQETGIELTPGWVGELLRTYGFVWRKAKLTIRNLQDPKEYEIAAKRLKRLKMGSCEEMPTTSFGSATA